jgi:hypothetical protein
MLNLTPHPVMIETVDGSKITLPVSGTVARVATQEIVISSVAVSSNKIVPLVTWRFGDIVGLPERDEPCLVSNLVFEAVRVQQSWRKRIFVPDTGPTAIRDDAGHIVAVRRLMGVSP